jgi:hypothetical protein
MAGHVLQQREGTLADERDGFSVGTDALASGAACGVGGINPHLRRPAPPPRDTALPGVYFAGRLPDRILRRIAGGVIPPLDRGEREVDRGVRDRMAPALPHQVLQRGAQRAARGWGREQGSDDGEAQAARSR